MEGIERLQRRFIGSLVSLIAILLFGTCGYLASAGEGWATLAFASKP